MCVRVRVVTNPPRVGLPPPVGWATPVGRVGPGPTPSSVLPFLRHALICLALGLAIAPSRLAWTLCTAYRWTPFPFTAQDFCLEPTCKPVCPPFFVYSQPRYRVYFFCTSRVHARANTHTHAHALVHMHTRAQHILQNKGSNRWSLHQRSGGNFVYDVLASRFYPIVSPHLTSPFFRSSPPPPTLFPRSLQAMLRAQCAVRDERTCEGLAAVRSVVCNQAVVLQHNALAVAEVCVGQACGACCAAKPLNLHPSA